MEISLLSDNHGYVGEDVLKHIEGCDEVWHAGDIGSLESLDPIIEIAPIRAVYGNIDNHEVRAIYPLDQIWTCEGVKVVMTHIGNYPPKYYKRIRQILIQEQADLYICGHSHICKVIPDQRLGLLHMNPGAYGHHGFHKVRTMLKFSIEDGKIGNLRVVELGLRGREN
jgi:putative phosphoesterase